MKQLYIIAIATIVMTLILIPLGGFVRQTGSGLACPDWPLCHGQVTPPMDMEGTLIEFSHRIVALIVSLLALTAGVFAIQHRRDSPFILKVAILSGVEIMAQVGLGAAVVLVELQPFLIMIHLAMALGFLATMIIMCVAAQQASQPRPAFLQRSTAGQINLLFATIAGLLILMLVGAFAGGSGARSWCTGWPLCNGQLIPVDQLTESWQVWVIFLHRALTVPVTALVLFAGWSFRTCQDRQVKLHTTMAACWMLVEIGLGALNPLTAFDIHIAVAHLGIAAFIWSHLVATIAFLKIDNPSHQSGFALS
jgi:heme A synthase